jgi:hypothetical protein
MCMNFVWSEECRSKKASGVWGRELERVQKRLGFFLSRLQDREEKGNRVYIIDLIVLDFLSCSNIIAAELDRGDHDQDQDRPLFLRGEQMVLTASAQILISFLPRSDSREGRVPLSLLIYHWPGLPPDYSQTMMNCTQTVEPTQSGSGTMPNTRGSAA